MSSDKFSAPDDEERERREEREKERSDRTKRRIRAFVAVCIIILLLLLLRSCGRVRDEPDIEPSSERVYETDRKKPVQDNLIPSADNPRLNLYISDCYRISEEEPCFYMVFPEENIFDVVFTLTDLSGNRIYQTGYVAPGTSVEFDISAEIPKGEQTLYCLVSVYEHETGELLSDCTTIEMKVIYQ